MPLLFGLWETFTERVLLPVAGFLSTKHALRYAVPDRKPPNPKFFPFYFQNRQGLWLKWTQWLPPRGAEPRAVLFIVNGLAEHTARYDSVAQRFAAKGFVVLSMDHQGQGLSEGERKHVERFADFVNDVEQFVHDRLEADGGALKRLPRFILGHSMGGLITTHLCMRHPRAFSGVVLSAPAVALDAKKASPFMRRLAGLLASVLPKLGADALDPRGVSRNSQVFELYVQDPGVPSNLLRVRWANEFMKAVDAVWTAPAKLCFPMLVLHGSADSLVPLEASERLAQTAVSGCKRLVVYDDAYHELFCDEKKCEQVYSDVFDFVEKRFGADKEDFVPAPQ